MSQLFINIVGHNGSGKSTLSKKLASDLGLNRVNGDDLRNLIRKNILYFKDMPLYMPTVRSRLMNPLIIEYRFMLTEVLLESGQNVIIDGSGAKREDRRLLFEKVNSWFPNAIKVLIFCDLPEDDLLDRLKKRDEAEGSEWQSKYKEIKIDFFEPPTADECKLFFVYDQNNYQAIEQELRKLL